MKHEADLTPPLGKPGGPCQVVQRIDRAVREPQLKEDMIDEVESGVDLSNSDASKIYRLDKERGTGPIQEILITAHGQYRMDLRSITVEDVRQALSDFVRQLDEWKAKRDPNYDRMYRDVSQGRKIEWVGKNSLKVVFELRGRTAHLITTFWKGRQDTPPPRNLDCRLASERVVQRFLSLQNSMFSAD